MPITWHFHWDKDAIIKIIMKQCNDPCLQFQVPINYQKWYSHDFKQDSVIQKRWQDIANSWLLHLKLLNSYVKLQGFPKIKWIHMPINKTFSLRKRCHVLILMKQNNDPYLQFQVPFNYQKWNSHAFKEQCHTKKMVRYWKLLKL